MRVVVTGGAAFEVIRLDTFCTGGDDVSELLAEADQISSPACPASPVRNHDGPATTTRSNVMGALGTPVRTYREATPCIS